MTILSRSLSAAAGLALLATAACVPQTRVTEPAQLEPATQPPDLWDAAASGDIAGLESHRRAGTNLDGLQADVGITALATAVVSGQEAAAAWLLDNGADVNARNADGGTALIATGFLGLPEMAALLLDQGADPTAANDQGLTVWDIAALDWQTTSYIAGLLELDVDQQTVTAGRTEVLRLLEPHRAAAAEQDIWLATAMGSVDAVRMQLAGGLDANMRNPDNGATLLTVAALFGHAEVAALLIDAGADVNARNYGDGSTALHAAAFFGRTDTVRLLLDNDADVHAISDDGGTPLQAAEMDWATTQYLAGMMQVQIDETAVMAGKAAVVELLRPKQ